MSYRKYQFLKNMLLIGISMSLLSCVSTTSNPNDKPVSDVYSQDIFELSERAIAAYRAARWDEAARLYQQLTFRVPSDAYIWFRLANTYVQKGEFDQAIAAYTSSIERDAQQPKSWFNLSTTYMLNAKVAMLESWENLRADDPARELIQLRVLAIDNLMNEALGPIRAEF